MYIIFNYCVLENTHVPRMYHTPDGMCPSFPTLSRFVFVCFERVQQSHPSAARTAAQATARAGEPATTGTRRAAQALYCCYSGPTGYLVV